MARYLIFLGLLLAACGGGTGAAEPLKAKTITCNTAYRSSTGRPIEREETLTFTDKDDEQSAAFTDLVFHAAYDDGQLNHERALRLWVTDVEGVDVLQTQLYQLESNSGPNNQFVGGHGFTGLNYTYHPRTTAELQFWCVVE